MAIKILLVDDSEVIRFMIGKALERDPELRLVATAADGIEAVAMARLYQPDVILLDIDMPRMDGLTALPQIVQSSPGSKVILVSSLSPEHAHAAISSLGRGVCEFVAKLNSGNTVRSQALHEELKLKIKAIMSNAPHEATPKMPLPTKASSAHLLRQRSVKLLPPRAPEILEASTQTSVEKNLPLRTHASRHRARAIAIASSTGGPEALMKLFHDLRGKLAHVPILITQHMPPIYTAVLAEHIERYGERPCKEAEHGETPKPGHAYVAPGGYHMVVKTLDGKPTLFLTQDDIEFQCCPSADPMFASASHVYGKGLLAVVLTGIGQDGTLGAKVVANNGGIVIAQNQETSVVYGMPRSVAAAGICNAILPLESLAAELTEICRPRIAQTIQ